uniref:DDE Tnp4 domain-containing protein n=1 Tax=Amphimedon queenslandica TaxID=400682 RepID=A0A1X7V6J5_AMPQE
MRLSDPESHFRYLRMTKESFDFILSKGRSSVSNIIKETCEAIWLTLGSEYVRAPSSKKDWLEISNEFEMRWNFPNCIGAIDGKHIIIESPDNSGSLYYNYEGTFSVVLLAICDAHYRFTLVVIGQAGRFSDGGVFSNFQFGDALEYNELNTPDSRCLPGSTKKFPYVLVGDEAFPLKTWRLFRKPIRSKTEKVIPYVQATISLHNYLRTKETSMYAPPGFDDTEDDMGNQYLGS